MKKYMVQVWIDEFEVDADTADAATDCAMDMVRNGDIRLYPDYAEAHEVNPSKELITEGK